MNIPLHRTLAATVLALFGAGFGAAAAATDTAATTKPASPAAASASSPSSSQSAADRDRGQVVPARSDLTPHKPSVGVLDDNTQRAHDRDQGVSSRGGTNGSQEVASGQTRDWQAIDRNHDNLISPDEMQQALDTKSQPPAAKPAQ